MARFQQTLRRLAMGDQAFVQDEAELGLDRAGAGPGSQDRPLLRSERCCRLALLKKPIPLRDPAER